MCKHLHAALSSVLDPTIAASVVSAVATHARKAVGANSIPSSEKAVTTAAAAFGKVGVIDLIAVSMTTETNGRADRYQIYVRGKRDEKFNDLVAVVDVSRGSGGPKYVFRCTNPDIAYVSAAENPCKGGVK